MRITITRDTCPLCGEREDLEKDIYAGTYCYCRACRATWNYNAQEIWGYDRDGKKTPAQKRIDDRVTKRKTSAAKYDWK
jgi:hypothetical protein